MRLTKSVGENWKSGSKIRDAREASAQRKEGVNSTMRDSQEISNEVKEFYVCDLNFMCLEKA